MAPDGVDNVFGRDDMKVSDFVFDQNVANVFDDMVSRSVPFYNELQKMFVSLAKTFVQPETSVYDLGCSTGVTLSNIAEGVDDPSVTYVGVDNSDAMLEKARCRLAEKGLAERSELRNGDLNKPINIANASLVLMNWTLQFVRPLNRGQLMEEIFNGLTHGGALIMAEKVLAKDSLINRLYIDYYYRYKNRQGYSDTEISKKREALENVLVPYRVDENVELLRDSGFQIVDVFFRWFNWAGFVAIKI